MEANEDISELLEAICEYCSEANVINIFLKILKADSVSSKVKLPVISSFEQLVIKMRSKLQVLKEIKDILCVFYDLLFEESTDIREAAKSVIVSIANSYEVPIEFDKLVHKCFEEKDIKRLEALMKSKETKLNALTE